MATPTPATPQSQVTSPAPRTDSPGTWKHPRFEEIQKRQNATIFGERNLRRAVWNGAAFTATLIFSQYFYTLLAYLSTTSGLNYGVVLIRLYFLANLVLAFRPFFAPRDNITDIPLTPSQRAGLGLDPSIPSPATAGNGYVTPPKYRLSSGSFNSPTPQSGRSFSSPYSSSPLSTKGPSPTPFRTASRGGSPYSPSASPLLQKAIGSGGSDREANRRLTFGAQSGLSRSTSLKDGSSFKVRGTPSPSGLGKGGNGGLNYKWLYERGAQSPSRRESMLL